MEWISLFGNGEEEEDHRPTEYQECGQPQTPLDHDELEPFCAFDPCPKCLAEAEVIKLTCLNVKYIPEMPDTPTNKLDGVGFLGYSTIEFDYLRRHCLRCGHYQFCRTADDDYEILDEDLEDYNPI